jgi:hypothetical protein
MIAGMKTLLASFIVLGLFALTGCPADDDPLGGACGNGFNAENGTVGDFGAGEAAGKVEAFLHAAADVYGASIDVEADILGACTAMAGDLGIPDAELEPTGSELPVTAACGRVSDEIDAIVALLPTGVALGISATPPSCTVDLDIAASCAAECDVTITGDATVECMGELHGSCSATCTGSCSVMGTVSCDAECSGSCTGSCSGTCHGACSGTCSAMDDQGNCVGTCSGTCTGSCDADCSGTCSGTCTSDVTATCEGECYGECSATWDAQCNGEANVDANADCQAACDARANATATCTEPDVTVTGVQVPDAGDQARIDALVMTLADNYPAILQAQARIQLALAPSLDAFVDSVQGAASSLADAGVQAAACMAVAVDVVSEAAGRIDASVSVTVEVSASVSASGGA